MPAGRCGGYHAVFWILRGNVLADLGAALVINIQPHAQQYRQDCIRLTRQQFVGHCPGQQPPVSIPEAQQAAIVAILAFVAGNGFHTQRPTQPFIERHMLPALLVQGVAVIPDAGAQLLAFQRDGVLIYSIAGPFDCWRYRFRYQRRDGGGCHRPALQLARSLKSLSASGASGGNTGSTIAQPRVAAALLAASTPGLPLPSASVW